VNTERKKSTGFLLRFNSLDKTIISNTDVNKDRDLRYNVNMAKANNQSDKNLVKRSAFEVADAIASNIVGVNIAWALVKALSGNALELRQQRALEFIEAIQSDQSTFNKAVVSSEEFQDGFVVALTEYIKIRNSLKRRIALKMFNDFANSDDKVEFPLERFYDTLNKLSTSGIKTLAFIKSEILPLREQGVKDDLDGKNLGTEKPYEWWYEQNLKSEPVSTYFSKWISDRYSPNSQLLKDRHNNGENIDDKELLGRLFDTERDIREKMNAPLGELEYLGLISWGSDPKNTGWDSSGGNTAWRLTGFAYEFMEFIENSPEYTSKS